MHANAVFWSKSNAAPGHDFQSQNWFHKPDLCNRSRKSENEVRAAYNPHALIYPPGSPPTGMCIEVSSAAFVRESTATRIYSYEGRDRNTVEYYILYYTIAYYTIYFTIPEHIIPYKTIDFEVCRRSCSKVLASTAKRPGRGSFELLSIAFCVS